MNAPFDKQGSTLSSAGIDFSGLMDLRVDYAFKLIFGSPESSFLISLLNAVFANKKFPRIVKSLTVVNPYLEKHSKGDKLSILDIRALLDDGSAVLVEMHLYDIGDLTYKTIRSWARAYGEEITSGESYSSQPPVICVAFVNGSIDDGGHSKIHKCCKIMDIDDRTVFSDALELHYINIKGVEKMIEEKTEMIEPMLLKWLAVITEKDIKDKSIIENICKEDEVIEKAVSTLARLSGDKITRQAYQKRLDEIMLYNMRINEYKRIAEQESQRAEQESQRAIKAEAEVEKLRMRLVELEAQQKQ